ncbi:hypothetical protein SDC9_48060 [bioreactor metagenome]|uniref:Transposase IS200-like domain-containing protein n=1 Tax=bioreactor metagenome TaxID=1076179 RepID=A0A644WDD7_9ZZZZ
MANTYTQLYVHFVFAVQDRTSLIKSSWKDSLYKYISAIINEQGHKPYIINGMMDHIHLLVSMNPKQSPSDLMYHVKRSSSKWINSNRLVMGKFTWQEGFGAFTLDKSQIVCKIDYIKNQQQHHAKKSFREEYLEFLKESEVDYDDRYIFRDV